MILFWPFSHGDNDHCFFEEATLSHQALLIGYIMKFWPVDKRLISGTCRNKLIGGLRHLELVTLKGKDACLNRNL